MGLTDKIILAFERILKSFGGLDGEESNRIAKRIEQIIREYVDE